MTTKDHPRLLFTPISVAWLGEEAAEDRRLWDQALNRPPDRLGETNPDEETTRWEWDTDLTSEENTLFDEIVDSAKAGMSRERHASIKTEIDFLKTYYQATGTPTAAQNVQAIKALIKVVRTMWWE